MTMSEQFTGGCACGSIRYESKGAAQYMGNCHCEDCKKATGGPYLPAVLVLKDDFTLSKGEPRIFESASDAASVLRRLRCASLSHQWQQFQCSGSVC